MYDARGGSLVSLVRRNEASLDGHAVSAPLARSIVVVLWGRVVLMGFHVTRLQWEVPGGALEVGESAHDAALRELAEETGIGGATVSLVATAEFMYGGEASRHVAAVFLMVTDSAPVLVESDEMDKFGWWDPAGALWDEMNSLDAEVVRRCVLHD